MRRARAALVVPLVLAAGLVAGCDGLGGTDGKGYVTQDGAITQIAAADRGDAVSVSGTDLDGKPIDLASYRGKPLVVNVWGSWCGPCIAEGSTLAAAASAVDVPFVGIDIRDDTESAKSFNRDKGITYPSIFDAKSTALLAFRDYPVVSPPTTYVLDARGRIAAVVAGSISSPQSLEDLISDVSRDG